LYGDFHDIQFPQNTVDIVFSNCVDHVYDIDNFIEQIKECLKPNGYLIIEAWFDSQDVDKFKGFYESFWYSDLSHLIKLFEQYNLKIKKDLAIEYPRSGRLFVLMNID